MAISLSKSAAERVQKYLDTRTESVGLRLGITKTGCSGYSYVINYAEQVEQDDVIFEDRGVKIVVDPDALRLIDGTEVDFVKNGLNEAFSFKNPNVTGECGCGESFNV
ncbi:MAG: HesB/IscA family protein [Woeseiaceae bacterium]